jgi:putative membrane protein
VRDTDDTADEPLGSLAARGGVGGVLMGLANLVPGISGGTMLLAAGVYPQFIHAIAELTTLTFRKRSLVVLASVVVAAGVAIVLFAGPVKDLVVNYRWMAYSAFIGLTLGGVPIVWRLITRVDASVWGGAAAGIVLMTALAWSQNVGAGTSGPAAGGFVMMLLAGVAGASAMILPGVSGGYLLLVLGVYVPILSAIDAVKVGVKGGDMSSLSDPVLGIVLPVGIGVVIGIVIVSNGLKWLLARFERPTLGVLLGLLVGAVVGLWPFQRGVAPTIGAIFKGQTVTAETLAKIKPEDYPTAFFDPTLSQIAGALGLAVLGYLTTTLVARLGKKPE